MKKHSLIIALLVGALMFGFGGVSYASAGTSVDNTTVSQSQSNAAAVSGNGNNWEFNQSSTGGVIPLNLPTQAIQQIGPNAAPLMDRHAAPNDMAAGLLAMQFLNRCGTPTSNLIQFEGAYGHTSGVFWPTEEFATMAVKGRTLQSVSLANDQTNVNTRAICIGVVQLKQQAPVSSLYLFHAAQNGMSEILKKEYKATGKGFRSVILYIPTGGTNGKGFYGYITHPGTEVQSSGWGAGSLLERLATTMISGVNVSGAFTSGSGSVYASAKHGLIAEVFVVRASGNNHLCTGTCVGEGKPKLQSPAKAKAEAAAKAKQLVPVIIHNRTQTWIRVQGVDKKARAAGYRYHYYVKGPVKTTTTHKKVPLSEAEKYLQQQKQ